MKVWLNDLFTVANTRVKMHPDRFNYFLKSTYPIKTVYQTVGDTTYAKHPDTMQLYGLTLLSQYLDKEGLYIMYGLALASNGVTELRYYHERMQRDNVLIAAGGLPHRPPLYATRGFDFIIPRNVGPKHVECEMVFAYNRLCRKLLSHSKLKPGPNS